MSGQSIDHVLRPRLPWRDGPDLTECGLPADDRPTLTRDELFHRAKKLGKQRTCVLTCVTCLQTAQRHRPWDESPVEAILREATLSRWAREATPLEHELRAIALLIDAHRDEFAATVEALGTSVPDLSDRRKAKATRR